MITIIFLVFGLIIGSFLNVVVYRLQMVETILGRSKCPYCKKQIRWYDNVPLLSFILLKFRCRDCGEKISWRYPAVEAVTGVAFALAGHYFFSAGNFGSWWETLFYLGIFSFLIVIAAYDFKYREIPMTIIWQGVAWSIVFSLILDWINFTPGLSVFDLRIFSGLVAGIAAFLFFFALSAGSKEKWMGHGDAYVALLIGLAAGWPGLLVALLLAFSIGAILGIMLILFKRGTMKSQIPFAPFLTIGFFLEIFILKIFPEVNYYLVY